MNEQLLSEDDQTSQEPESMPRANSLLERIRSQREREAAAETENHSAQMDIGNYAPPTVDGATDNPHASSFSMNFGNDYDPIEASQGLLSGQNDNLQIEYSMKKYFLTFVMDMYTLFRQMPLPVQVISIFWLLWVVWKLI